MLLYIKLISLALLLSAGLGNISKAASFDCNKATTETEIAICAEPIQDIELLKNLAKAFRNIYLK